MTVVVGTAGHIDHGKTTLLRALTGIDADRLPEEQRRGMTIDVGYAHLDLEDGSSIDFVDVPGHDALIGNMLVGAGEIDAAMLVVAADDGPRAQTLEHLALLDALGVREGLAVVTKADVVDAGRAAEVADIVAGFLARTSLAASPVLVASATTGDGLDAVRESLVQLRDRVAIRLEGLPAGPRRLAIDRAFAVRGRGAVVTGTLRGGILRAGDLLRLEPGTVAVRVRGLQVHHGSVDVAAGGRTAVNLTGAELGQFTRGAVLTSGPGIETTDRLLVALAPPVDLGPSTSRRNRPAWPPVDGTRVRLHLGTAQVDALIGRRLREGSDLSDGRVGALLRLAEPVATFVGDRGLLRRPSPGDVVAGLVVLDPLPPRGIARRRVNPERLAALAVAIGDGDADGTADALVGLHGAVGQDRVAAAMTSLTGSSAEAPERVSQALILAPDIGAALETAALELVGAFHLDHPIESGMPLASLRPALRTALRRHVSIRREATAGGRHRGRHDRRRPGGPAKAGSRRRTIARSGPRRGSVPGPGRGDGSPGGPPERARAPRPVRGGSPVRVPARGHRGDGIGRPDRPRGGESRVGGPRVPSVGGDCPCPRAEVAPDARGTPRCDRHQPSVRDAAHRRPEPPRDPGPDAERARARTACAARATARESARQTEPAMNEPAMTERALPLDHVTGIVLAGGRSSRFGSDKLAAELDGRPLLHHALTAVAMVAAQIVVVVAPDAEPAIPQSLEARVRVVHDPEPFGGPLVGLVAALAYVDSPIAIVVGGDMPNLVPAVLHRLVTALGPAQAALLEVPGRVQPLPAALDVPAARAAGSEVVARGGRSLRDLLGRLDPVVLPAPVWLALDPAAATIADIDRPSDLRPRN